MIIRLILFLLLIYLLYKIFSFIRQSRPLENKYDKYKTESSKGEELVEDPVCHTYVPISQAFKKKYPAGIITSAVNDVVINTKQKK